MVLNENTTLFLFWIIFCFLKIGNLNILLLSLWLELVTLFLCYDIKLGASPKYALQMVRWVYIIYWNNMVKITHINHRRPPNIISSLSTFFENKRDCMLSVTLNSAIFSAIMQFCLCECFCRSVWIGSKYSYN